MKNEMYAIGSMAKQTADAVAAAPIADVPITPAPVSPQPLAPPPRTKTDAFTDNYGFYGAGAVGGLGAALLVAATVFGAQSRSERNSARLDGSMSQLEAGARFDESSRLAKRANILFMVGGALALVGASWLGYDSLREVDVGRDSARQ